MISLNKNLQRLHAFGADGEAPLADAFAHEFKKSVRLTCFNHVRRNIKDEMHKLAIPGELQTEVLNDIFGKRIGSTLLTGLVDSPSIMAYEEKITCLMNKWSLYDDDDEQGPFAKFCSWFDIYKKNMIRDTMHLPVREKAGLGSPPEPFYNNASECINNVIKVKVDYKKSELPVFISKMLDLIGEQQQEAEKAIVGSGKYSLRCSSLEIPQNKWYMMSRDMRKHHLNKFNNATVPCLSAELVTVTQSSKASSDLSAEIASSSLNSTVDQHEVIDSETDLTSSIEPSLPITESSTTSTHSVSFLSTLPGPLSRYSVAESELLYEKLAPLSARLGLPTAAIRGIATKAAEILQVLLLMPQGIQAVLKW